MKSKIYQIGIPIDKLVNILVHWEYFEPRQKMVINPSVKTKDLVVVETRDMEFAAAIIRDIPEAKVREIDKRVVTL